MEQRYKRFHLLGSNCDEQAAAWNRLRSVCIDLGLQIPTRGEVTAFHHEMDDVTFKEKVASLKDGFDDGTEYAEFLELYALTDTARKKKLLVNFTVGYILE